MRDRDTPRTTRGLTINDRPPIPPAIPGDLFFAPGIAQECVYDGTGAIVWVDAAGGGDALTGATMKRVRCAAWSQITSAGLATRVGNVITATGNGDINASGLFDGITNLLLDERVVLYRETAANGPDNGIYSVTDLGSAGTPFVLTRADDALDEDHFAVGCLVNVTEGTLYGRSVFQNWSDVGYVVNTSSITVIRLPWLITIDQMGPNSVGSSQIIDLNVQEANLAYGVRYVRNVRCMASEQITTVGLATRVGNVITATGNGDINASGLFDGITNLSVPQRVGLFLESGGNGVDNGLYTVTDLGSAGTPFVLTRTVGAQLSSDFVIGNLVDVREGDVYGGFLFKNNSGETSVMNVDPLVLAPIGLVMHTSGTFADRPIAPSVGDTYRVTSGAREGSMYECILSGNWVLRQVAPPVPCESYFDAERLINRSGAWVHSLYDEVSGVLSTSAFVTGSAPVTPSSAMVTVANAAGGLPAVVFDGNGYARSRWIGPSGAGARWVAVVVSSVTPGGGSPRHIVHYGSAANGSAWGLVSRTGGVDQFGNHYWTAPPAQWGSGIAPPTTTTPMLVLIQFDGAQDALYVDGNAPVTNVAAITTGATTALVIGANITGTETAAFRLHAKLEGVGVLDATQRAALRARSQSRFGTA